ncbi:choriolysin H [Sarotherodon galilaeus]
MSAEFLKEALPSFRTLKDDLAPGVLYNIASGLWWRKQSQPPRDRRRTETRSKERVRAGEVGSCDGSLSLRGTLELKRLN